MSCSSRRAAWSAYFGSVRTSRVTTVVPGPREPEQRPKSGPAGMPSTAARNSSGRLGPAMSRTTPAPSSSSSTEQRSSPSVASSIALATAVSESSSGASPVISSSARCCAAARRSRRATEPAVSRRSISLDTVSARSARRRRSRVAPVALLVGHDGDRPEHGPRRAVDRGGRARRHAVARRHPGQRAEIARGHRLPLLDDRREQHLLAGDLPRRRPRLGQSVSADVAHAAAPDHGDRTRGRAEGAPSQPSEPVERGVWGDIEQASSFELRQSRSRLWSGSSLGAHERGVSVVPFFCCTRKVSPRPWLLSCTVAWRSACARSEPNRADARRGSCGSTRPSRPADQPRSTAPPARAHVPTPPPTTWRTSSAPWRLTRLAPTAARWPEAQITAIGRAGSSPSGRARMSW